MSRYRVVEYYDDIRIPTVGEVYTDKDGAPYVVLDVRKPEDDEPIIWYMCADNGLVISHKISVFNNDYDYDNYMNLKHVLRFNFDVLKEATSVSKWNREAKEDN